VTLLDDYTFSKCYNLNEVIFIKDGVQYDDVPKLKAIGTNCFEYCYSLNTINLPSSLETIGAAAFRYCAKEKVREVNKQKEYLYTGLKELYLPDSISSIGNNAFQNCFNLEYVKLPANLKQINNYLFSGCGIQLKDSKGKEIVGSYKGIKTVVFPNNLESIGNYAFNSCYVLNLNESQLGDYTGNHTIKSIGRNAFEKCYSLRKLVIPYTLESIGQSAFESCINLESVDFESYSANLSAIGSSAFKNTAIKGSVVLPEKLSKVENNVFENCYFITSVEFPDGLTSVGSASFKNCNNLTTIKLPASAALVHSGDNSSFYGCIALSNSILKAVPADLSVYANSKGIVPIKCLTQITKAEVQNEQIATAIIDASGSMPVVNIFGVDDGRTSVEINGFMRFESGKDSNGIIYVIEVNTKVEFNINVTAIHCEEVRFTESRRGVALNKTITLQPVILPVETTDIRTWTSDNESVATVDSNGKVTALSYGSTTIRLKVGDQPEVQCQINVCAPANGFTMNTNSVNLYLDDEANNTYKVPYSITYHSNYKDFKDAYPDVIIWSSSDENVATVDQNGNIKVVGYGEARITARADAGNKTDSIDVAVLPSHTTVSFDKTEITVQKGESAQIIITLDPEKSPISKIKIQSSDKSIAVVNRNNNIITISGISGGSAKITASPEKGTAAECMVYVKSPLSSITASPMEIYKGATKTISLVKTPQDTTDTLIYTSSNPEIAQVDSNGKVTALKAGTVVINISSVENPTITAQCTVTVKVAVSSVSLNKTSLTLAVGDSYKLTATISPEDASNKDIGWTSSKPDIVSVDNGVITAVSDGSSVITVNTADGNKTARCVVTVVKNPVSINSISSNFSDNGSIVVSGEVKNIVDVDKTVTVIYALYDSNNKLKGLAKETITIAQKTTMKLQKEINVSGDLRNYTAKIMLWDSDFGTLKPLSESKSKSI